jgi:hypothetical protein
MNEEAQRLLNEGLALLNAGKRAEAVDTLKRAVEQDSENIEIWVALARALDDVDEKRIALTTVLQLDPNNEFAREALQEAERPATAAKADAGDWIPGVSRAELRTAVIGLTVFTIAALGIAALFYTSRASALSSERASLTQVAVEATQAAANLEGTLVQSTIIAETAFADATATLLALVSPTPTPTNTPARVLPTALPPTPTITPTPDLLRVAPVPPANLPGRIVGFRAVPGQRGTFGRPIVVPAGGGTITELNDDTGQWPTADTGFGRVVYVRAEPGLGTGTSLLVVPSADPNPLLGIDVLNELIKVGSTAPSHPRMTRDGVRMVFSARLGERTVLYTYIFGTNTLQRITPNDGADYTSAAISPDGSLVIAAKTLAGSTDLVLIAANDPGNAFPQTPLTSDGATTTEQFPDFSADGARVVYSAYTTNPSDADIFIADFNGTQLSGTTVLVSTTGNEIVPVFSPDGRYVAYTSTQTLAPNIFIFDITNRETYQLTESNLGTYAGAWVN